MMGMGLEMEMGLERPMEVGLEMGMGLGLEMEMVGLETEMGMSTPQCILGNAFCGGEQRLGRALSTNVIITSVGAILGDGRQRAEAQRQKTNVYRIRPTLSAIYKTPSENKKTKDNINTNTFSQSPKCRIPRFSVRIVGSDV